VANDATAADTLTPSVEPGGVIMKEEPVMQGCPVEIPPSDACTSAVASWPAVKTTAVTAESSGSLLALATTPPRESSRSTVG
jgi:hypothetical protein